MTRKYDYYYEIDDYYPQQARQVELDRAMAVTSMEIIHNIY